MPFSLSCPACGAPAPSADAARCEYCGSALTTISCPACFGTMFAGMQFCPHCGAKAARSVDESTTLPCPACRETMKSVLTGTTSLFECAACGGAWLDAETFTHLCMTRDERGAIVAM